MKRSLEVSRNLAESEEMEVTAEEEEEEKDNRLDTDVSMQETVKMETKDDIHFPVAPVLISVKVFSGLEWPDKIDKYFDEAITKLTEERYFCIFKLVYIVIVNKMFEEELEACVEEATHFFVTTN